MGCTVHNRRLSTADVTRRQQQRRQEQQEQQDKTHICGHRDMGGEKGMGWHG